MLCSAPKYGLNPPWEQGVPEGGPGLPVPTVLHGGGVPDVQVPWAGGGVLPPGDGSPWGRGVLGLQEVGPQVHHQVPHPQIRGPKGGDGGSPSVWLEQVVHIISVAHPPVRGQTKDLDKRRLKMAPPGRLLGDGKGEHLSIAPGAWVGEYVQVDGWVAGVGGDQLHGAVRRRPEGQIREHVHQGLQL